MVPFKEPKDALQSEHKYENFGYLCQIKQGFCRRTYVKIKYWGKYYVVI